MIVAGVGLGLMTGVAAAQSKQPKYGVTVTADKKTDFAALKTYAWTSGRPSFNKDYDRYITAAIDSELSKLGLTKKAAGAGDVLVAYESLRRTDVDLTSKPDEKGSLEEYSVGTLIVLMLDPKDRKEVLRARLDKPVDTDPAHAEAELGEAVADVFAKYPTRTR
jgi:hypothetical protein